MIIFLLSLLSSASSFECGGTTSKSSYKVGDRIPVCVIFDNGTTTKTITFYPKLDDYSAVEVKGIFVGIEATGNYSLAVQAEAGSNTTFRQYIQTGAYNIDDFVAPVYSVVVEMNDGKVKDIVWDNDCDLCDYGCLTDTGDVCTVDLCSLTTNSTDPLKSDCDPKIYVSWIGKDDSGNYLMSAGYRISQFRKYSLYDTYKSAKKSF